MLAAAAASLVSGKFNWNDRKRGRERVDGIEYWRERRRCVVASLNVCTHEAVWKTFWKILRFRIK